MAQSAGTPKRAERLSRVLELRDAALKLVQAHGRRRPQHPDDFGGTSQLAYVSGFEMLYTRWLGRTEALFGLDVNFEGKGTVLEIEWGPSDEVEVLRFHRGRWETNLVALAQGFVRAKAVIRDAWPTV